jgi:hypothetical protein
MGDYVFGRGHAQAPAQAELRPTCAGASCSFGFGRPLWGRSLLRDKLSKSFLNSAPFRTVLAGLSSDAQLIFPDASSTVSSYDPAKNQIRTASEPLLPGDFVDLGTYKAGTSLDFFLISNGANGGGNVFTAEAARNPDKIDHVVAFALSDSPYLILAYEDLYGGGDRDYNDVIVAVDIGKANIQRLVSAPEPSTWMILTGFMGLALFQPAAAASPRPKPCAIDETNRSDHSDRPGPCVSEFLRSPELAQGSRFKAAGEDGGHRGGAA